jgi:UDP-N-acetylglucosamine diphosphorylase/glucosamine-1-phosphate N-acetyltransferase
MSVRFVLFEDSRWADLRPLSELLPVAGLRLGDCTLAERWQRALGGELLAVEGRARALAAWRERPVPALARHAAGDEVWAVNAAALPEAGWLEAVREGRCPALYVSGERVAVARLGFAQLAPGLGRGTDFERHLLAIGAPVFGAEPRWLERPWQFVEQNQERLTRDLESQRPALEGQVHPLAALYEKDRIVVEAGARVDALAVLDARSGPIRVERGAWVVPQTVVYGPCVVGRDSWLLGGLIGCSTIGPGCRIQGEADSNIFQGWANKRHHGFVGHSWIGEWVNLGALTTTSDLKNNYGRVRVQQGGRELDTGLIKLGSMIGAHAKTSIGTLLATGAMVGSACNLFGGGTMSPKWLPPFSWWDGRRTVEYRLDAFLATARTVMGRRERPMLPEDEQALKELFEQSAGEREAAAGPIA